MPASTVLSGVTRACKDISSEFTLRPRSGFFWSNRGAERSMGGGNRGEGFCVSVKAKRICENRTQEGQTPLSALLVLRGLNSRVHQGVECANACKVRGC